MKKLTAVLVALSSTLFIPQAWATPHSQVTLCDKEWNRGNGDSLGERFQGGGTLSGNAVEPCVPQGLEDGDETAPDLTAWRLFGRAWSFWRA
jgi:hypothetical protein